MNDTREHLDCSDCQRHVQATVTEDCRRCTDQQERTGTWLPMFVAKAAPAGEDPYIAASKRRFALLYREGLRRQERLGHGPLVGLTGYARSGKDTVADYLVREHGFVKHSFAAPIREFVARILGMTLAELETNKEVEVPWLGTTPRKMMQTAGTEWGRNIDPALWIKSAMRRVNVDLRLGRSVVITDVRFDNEAEALTKAGGRIVRLTRPSAAPVRPHVSERPIADQHVTASVANDGLRQSLFRRIDSVLRQT